MGRKWLLSAENHQQRKEWLGAAGYDSLMIKSFRHKGIERFFLTGSKAGIQPKHSVRLGAQLALLDEVESPDKMNVPGWNLHPLRGDLAGLWAISVSGNWRLTFGFEGNDAVLVDYQDYH
jgi:proteic killer suppression protein